ncbi:EAL domain-containing protein [Ammoniphilus sp. CFH 90114]|uniref:EAL domain-containing protein n=1 Tax=Ammoniphilus sp. CFH 90114 TaxID=2493665 RepID=UPI00100E26AF|nr:EAL domain-containing protein [Ammoniphilus sp. CFH 90114]RXT04548.1 EAL domain-containing protein [Ammoniphilus sp. CFH 90114]
MSIKAKVATVFLLLVTVVLISNNALHYYSTKNILVENQKKLMEITAKEISIAIENSREGSKYIEDLIGEKLRVASLVAKYALSPQADQVTNEELQRLSKEIGVSHITLFQETEEDIIAVKSSDVKEVGIGSKEWGYWFDAFHQLLRGEEVTVPQGQKLPNYWAGPIDVSSSNPDHYDKWGYFYDGTTDYIIDPYVRDTQIQQFDEITGIKSFLDKTLQNNEFTLEITGFNPKAFGKEPIITQSNGISYVRKDDEPILFGNYSFKLESTDVALVNQAITTGKIQSLEAEINGKKVIKSFYPVLADKPYVIGLVNDYKLIEDVLSEQLYNNAIISIVILLIVFMVSYSLAGYLVRPVQYILQKVEEISKGDFSVRVERNSKDEIGLLSDGINTMSQNLESYTKQIRYQAEHDSLTNLPNRRAFTTQLQKHIEKADMNKDTIAVMFLDLDRFKSVNDGLGHTFGDQLLIAVANRMLDSLGQAYRIGGDEFTIILTDTSREEVGKMAQKILTMLNQPFTLDEHEVFVTTSIGISLFPTDGESVEHLVKNADIAMYRAKEEGKNTYHFFNSELNEQLLKRTTLERELRKALQRNEFQLYYQPKVNMKTGQITGVEALIRWFHPEMGLVSPGEFIPIAEETGLIKSIGDWVLRTACAQNKLWQEQGYPPMRVAVNLSAQQFQQSNLIHTIMDVLEQTKLEAKYLEIEITENVAMSNADFVIEKLNKLKSLGIHLAIDDFGTGYSSLSYLKKFPIDTLKIDRSFIRDISKDIDNETIITTIIVMAHHLKLNIVAEGVEEEHQLSFLRQQNCHEIQGFLIARPLSVQDFERNFQNLQEVAAGYQS